MDMEDLEEFMIPKEAFERLKDPDLMRQYVEEGRIFQEILGFADETMDKFYQVAHALFTHHRLKEASDAFLFLTTLNPFVPEYWLGLGMCEQLNEEYRQALVAYGMVVIADRHHAVAHYHSAACHNGMGDLDQAIFSLDKAIHAAGEDENFAEIKKLSVRARERLMEKKETK